MRKVSTKNLQKVAIYKKLLNYDGWNLGCFLFPRTIIAYNERHLPCHHQQFCIVECDKLKLWHLLFIFIHFGVCSLRLGWVSNEYRCGLSLCVLIELKMLLRWFCDHGNLWGMSWEILWDEWDLAEDIWWIFNDGLGI